MISAGFEIDEPWFEENNLEFEEVKKESSQEMEEQAKHHWKFTERFGSKKVQKDNAEADGLYGKSVHVLQEMLESDNAQHRLQAADIVMRHSIKQRGKIRFSN